MTPRAEVFRHRVAVHVLLHLQALLLISRVSPKRRQRIRRQGYEIEQGQATRYVFHIWVEAPSLMPDDHPRQLPGRFCRAGKVGVHGSRTLWRGIIHVAGLDPRIILGNLLRQGVIRAEALQQSGPADAEGKLRRAIGEFAAGNCPVRIFVIQAE